VPVKSIIEKHRFKLKIIAINSVYSSALLSSFLRPTALILPLSFTQ